MPDQTGGAAAPAAKSVYIHVGAPTAGGGYLQRALWHNRRALAEAGVCYPLHAPLEHFAATMDLRRMTWGGHRDPQWDGTWDRIADRIRDWDGPTAVLSQELLGGATENQVKAAVASLEPADVHIVFVTRDLSWQLVLDWQEQIKHSHTIEFGRFVDDLVARGIDAAEPFGPMFWGLHDVERVLGGWATAVPPQRCHVLTLPPPGHRADLVWSRFWAAIGIEPPAGCDIGTFGDDPPLGVVEAALLRKLNERAVPALGADYEAVVREHVVDTLLVDRMLGTGDAAEPRDTAAGGRRPAPMALPARHQEWAGRRAAELVAAVRAAGYRVTGDLAELLPVRPRGAAPQPEDVPDAALTEAAVGVLTGLLRRLADDHDRAGLMHLQDELALVRENTERLLRAANPPSSALRRAVRRSGEGPAG